MVLFNDVMCLISGPVQHGRPALHGGQSHQIKSATSQAVYPLTKSQEGMWNDYLANSGGTKYSLTLEWDLRRRPGPDPPLSEIMNGKNMSSGNALRP